MRGFNEVFSPEERAEFLEVLFGMAKADGEISDEEDQEIGAIGRGFGLLNMEFVDAISKFTQILQR